MARARGPKEEGQSVKSLSARISLSMVSLDYVIFV
jgi:hypothetical protein